MDQIANVGVCVSIYLKLISRKIIFITVTEHHAIMDRQTGGQTTNRGITVLCIAYRTVKIPEE